MKSNEYTYLLLFLGFLALTVCVQRVDGWQDQLANRRPGIVKQIGTFVSPTGACEVSLKIGKLGGHLILVLGDRSKREINDVTGIQWLSGAGLIYSVSPIYGKPGIYLFDCRSDELKVIVGGKNVSTSYPNGADYFELEGVTQGSPRLVYFYYARDVDKVDFKSFPTKRYLFEVQLNGKGFRKSK